MTLLLPNNLRTCHLVRIQKPKEKMFGAHDILIIGRAEVNDKENPRSISSHFFGPGQKDRSHMEDACQCHRFRGCFSGGNELD